MQLAFWRDQVPLAVCSFKWAPHPSFDVSVKICRACFSGCNEVHCLLPVTTLDGGARTWELERPFPVIPEPSTFEVELVTYKLEDLLESSSDFSTFTSQPSFWQISTSSRVCWRQAWWDLALRNHLSRYWWILIPMCRAINFTSFATTVNSMGAVDNANSSALNWYARPWMWNLRYFLDYSCICMW